MAYYFLFPETDATIYRHPDRTNMNTGGDEILEIIKERGTDDQRYYPSRILMKFTDNDIDNVINNKIGNYSSSAGLTLAQNRFSSSIKLFLADATELPFEYEVEAYPIFIPGSGELSEVDEARIEKNVNLQMFNTSPMISQMSPYVKNKLKEFLRI